MRISDWSSDVCSSDLRGDVTGDGIPHEGSLSELHQNEAFVLRGFLERVPDDPADPDHQPREEGLVEDLRGHADVVDDGLASPRPGAERVVTEDTHDRSCSGSSSPLSRMSRRASPNPLRRLWGDRNG